MLFYLCCFIFPHFRYHLKDVIVGKIYFLLVRIKIKHMEIQIIKRESTGTGIHSFICYAPTMTMAGALSVTPVRPSVCMYVCPNDVRSLTRILLIRIL